MSCIDTLAFRRELCVLALRPWRSEEGALLCEVPETPETNKFLSDQTIRIKSSSADRTLEESRGRRRRPHTRSGIYRKRRTRREVSLFTSHPHPPFSSLSHSRLEPSQGIGGFRINQVLIPGSTMPWRTNRRTAPMMRTSQANLSSLGADGKAS